MLFRSLSTLLFPAAVLAAWGYREEGDNWVIDTGSQLVAKVSKKTADITSLKYGGVEYSGNNKTQHSQLGDGLNKWARVSIKKYDKDEVIKVTADQEKIQHILLFRAKLDNVYIFVNKTDNSTGVHRYNVRIPKGIFDADAEPDIAPPHAKALEGADVFSVDESNGKSKGTSTRSSYYSGRNYGRTIDYHYIGFNNSKVGMYLVRNNREKASGGPFARAALREGVEDGGLNMFEVYYDGIGHVDVERYGLQGPSVLTFTNGGAPSSHLFANASDSDTKWIDKLEIRGWVPRSNRSWVEGEVANVKNDTNYVVGLKSGDAQYWGTVGSTGKYMIKHVLPGNYTLTLYKEELEVNVSNVTVSDQGTQIGTLLPADPSDDPFMWRIGEWDGSPRGMLNFNSLPMKPTYMHPSDASLQAWNATDIFTVGSSPTSDFPGYLFKDINNDRMVRFRLNATQLQAQHVIRVGLTEAYNNGRPTLRVNAVATAFLPDSGAAPTYQAKTRSLTVGTYRGNNTMLTYTVPPEAWLPGVNEWQVVTLSVVSGVKGYGGFLSPAISIDCIDMVQRPIEENAQAAVQ